VRRVEAAGWTTLRQVAVTMKIAILGSTGFLGKVLLGKALEAGYQVRTLVRDRDPLGPFRSTWGISPTSCSNRSNPRTGSGAHL
jgi:hypothetical protein